MTPLQAALLIVGGYLLMGLALVVPVIPGVADRATRKGIPRPVIAAGIAITVLTWPVAFIHALRNPRE